VYRNLCRYAMHLLCIYTHVKKKLILAQIFLIIKGVVILIRIIFLSMTSSSFTKLLKIKLFDIVEETNVQCKLICGYLFYEYCIYIERY
jgi:hypothetical protein